MNTKIFAATLQQQIDQFGYPPTFGPSAHSTHLVWNCRDLGEHWGRDGVGYMDRCMASLRAFLFPNESGRVNVSDLTFTSGAMSILPFRLVRRWNHEIWCQCVPFPDHISSPFCQTPFPVRIRVAEYRDGLQPEWVVHEYWGFAPLEKRDVASEYVDEKLLEPVKELMEGSPEYRGVVERLFAVAT